MVVVCVCLAVALVFIYRASQEEGLSHDITVNEGIKQIETFQISSDSVEVHTSAEGTIYSGENRDGRAHAKIVASLTVDPKDWGGVAFYMPASWYVVDMTSSYPEEVPQRNPEDEVAVWTNENSSRPWSGWIEIGRDRSYRLTGGGTGTVVIELVSEQPVPGVAYVTVSVGTDKRNGYRVQGTDSIQVPIWDSTSGGHEE
ncbi:hypothetical protein IDH44_23155 [Paenibacillus sp. IB182496]|uniref:Uncharacterized protein n=1 Tax=Paenibacillus sabuli TaxID=2772509 RepID=A0A927BY90_9BACL|nr:hypothetical protein [Paenibacillus sabuli]MBD2848106.1 hypothetical protein [Paenibacillus sabuli]